MGNLPPHGNQGADSDVGHFNTPQHFHRDLFDQIPTQVIVFDLLDHDDLKFVYMNRAALKEAGLPPEAIGQRLSDFLPPPEAVRTRQMAQAVLTSGTLVEIEESVTMPNGVKWFYTRYIPIQRSDGQMPQILLLVENITARKQQQLAEQQHQAEVIEQQAVTLAELSTPLLAISDSAVAMPLIGAIDTRRIELILDTLLAGVAASRATTVILDITGVPVVDSQVANALVQAAQAVKLLGAEAVLTGMRPEVAQTLVQLGVSLRSIVTRATLQDGIAFALHRDSSR